MYSCLHFFLHGDRVSAVASVVSMFVMSRRASPAWCAHSPGADPGS